MQGSVDSENISDEPLSEITYERQPAVASQSSVAPTIIRQPSRRRGQIPPELQEAGHQMKESFSILKNVINKKQIEEDECDLYGKLLAKKLRKLSEDERQNFMYEIDGMYIQRYQSGRVNVSPSSPNFSHESQFSTNPPLTSPSESNVPTRSSSSNSAYSTINYPLQPHSDLHIITRQPSTQSLLSPSEINVTTRPESSHSTHSEKNYFLHSQSDVRILNRPSSSHSLQSHASYLAQSANYPLSEDCAGTSSSSQSALTEALSNITYLHNVPQQTGSSSSSSQRITILSAKTKTAGEDIIKNAYFNTMEK